MTSVLFPAAERGAADDRLIERSSSLSHPSSQPVYHLLAAQSICWKEKENHLGQPWPSSHPQRFQKNTAGAPALRPLQRARGSTITLASISTKSHIPDLVIFECAGSRPPPPPDGGVGWMLSWQSSRSTFSCPKYLSEVGKKPKILISRHGGICLSSTKMTVGEVWILESTHLSGTFHKDIR